MKSLRLKRPLELGWLIVHRLLMTCNPIKFGGVVVAILAATMSFAQDSSEEVFLQEQAEKDKQIAHANAFLRTINGREDYVQQEREQQRVVNEPSY